MTESHSNPQKSEQNSRSPALHIVFFTALASAMASLIIGILSLNRRRHPASPEIPDEYFADDQDLLPDKS